jgi:probable rRNA maturation factor
MEQIEQIIKIVLKELNEDINVSLVFCSRQTIHELNLNYRKKDKPTDVLSFIYGDRSVFDDEESFYGEIVICPEIAEKQAPDFGGNLNSEIKRLLIHGILHLTGYDHEKSRKDEMEMNRLQEIFLKKVEDIKVC